MYIRIYCKIIFIFRSRVNEPYLANFYWASFYNITRVEALDQSQGAGGQIYLIGGGIHRFRVSLFFEQVQGPIDFLVNIYGEPLTPNDYIVGELTRDSILLYT